MNGLGAYSHFLTSYVLQEKEQQIRELSSGEGERISGGWSVLPGPGQQQQQASPLQL